MPVTKVSTWTGITTFGVAIAGLNRCVRYGIFLARRSFATDVRHVLRIATGIQALCSISPYQLETPLTSLHRAKYLPVLRQLQTRGTSSRWEPSCQMRKYLPTEARSEQN